MGKCQSRSSERLERLAQAVMDHAECELAIKHLKKVCGEPAPEMELEVQWQEHDLGEYPMIVLTWMQCVARQGNTSRSVRQL